MDDPDAQPDAATPTASEHVENAVTPQQQLCVLVSRMALSDRYRCGFCHRQTCMFTAPRIQAKGLTLPAGRAQKRDTHTASTLWNNGAAELAWALVCQHAEQNCVELTLTDRPRLEAASVQRAKHEGLTLQRKLVHRRFTLHMVRHPQSLVDVLPNASICDPDPVACLRRLRARRKSTPHQRVRCIAGVGVDSARELRVELDGANAAAIRSPEAEHDDTLFCRESTGAPWYHKFSNPLVVCQEKNIQLPAKYWCQSCADTVLPNQDIHSLEIDALPLQLPGDCGAVHPRCRQTELWNRYGPAALATLNTARGALALYDEESVEVTVTLRRQVDKFLFDLTATRQSAKENTAPATESIETKPPELKLASAESCIVADHKIKSSIAQI